MALSYGASGTSSQGTTSVTPQYPTGISATTSELFAIVAGRSSVADTVISTPAGWTSLVQLESGTGTFGVDTGTRRVGMFRKDTVTGSESGSVSFSFGAGTGSSTMSGTIFRVEKTAGYTVTSQVSSGADTTNGTSYSATSSDSLDFNTGDFLLIGTAQNIDTGTISSRAVSATGVTFGTVSLWIDAAVVNGSDHRRIMQTVTANSADTATTVTYSYTNTANCSGATAFVLLTETPTDVTLALVGSGATASTGTVSVPRTNGQAAAFSQGSISAVDVSRLLDGQAITAGQGVVSPNADGTVPLLGLASTASAGSVAPDLSKEQTGSEVTAAQQSIAIDLRPTDITSPTLTISAGTLTVEGGGDVTVHLSGVESTSGLGVVDSGGQPLSGSASTSAAGTVPPSADVALTGLSFDAFAGTITPEQLADDTYIASATGSAVGSMDVALVGSAATAEAGDVVVTGDAEDALTGAAATAAAGTAPPSVDVALSGVFATGEHGNLGAPGGAALTGAAVSVVAGTIFTTEDRDRALTGASSTVQQGTCFASPLAFVTGQSLTASQEQIGERSIRLTGSEVTVSAGDVDAGPNNSTGFILYIPFRAVAGIFTEGGEVSDALNASTNKNWLPPPNEPLVDERGRMRPAWFKFFEYVANKKLGGINAPSLPDIEAAVNASAEAVTSNTTTVAEVAEVVLQNAAALAATVEVAQNNSLSGSTSVPAVRTTIEK